MAGDTQPEAVPNPRRQRRVYVDAHATRVGHAPRRRFEETVDLEEEFFAAHAATVGHVRYRNFEEFCDAHAARAGHARRGHFEETVDLEEELDDARATRVGHSRRRHFEETIDPDEELEAETPVKKTTIMDLPVKKKMIRDRGRDEIKRMRKSKKKLFLIPDTNNCQLTLEVSLKNAQSVSDEEQMVTYFASALNAVNEHLGNLAIDALKTRSFDLQVCKIPSQASEAMVDPVYIYDFNAREVHVILGVCFFLLFKNLTEDNYSGFITKRVQALIGKVGISAERKKQMTNFFSFKQAAAIGEILGGYFPLKQGVISFCCANAEDPSSVGLMARYVKHILSWNEMTHYKLVYDTLWVPKSPVLSDPAIQHEVANLTLTFDAIFATEEPQFFRYFCSDTQKELLMRNRISVLGAVAKQLSEDKYSTSTVQRFKSSMSKESSLVTRLVNLHRSYVRKYAAFNNPLTKFLSYTPRFEDLDI